MWSESSNFFWRRVLLYQHCLHSSSRKQGGSENRSSVVKKSFFCRGIQILNKNHKRLMWCYTPTAPIEFQLNFMWNFIFLISSHAIHFLYGCLVSINNCISSLTADERWTEKHPPRGGRREEDHAQLPTSSFISQDSHCWKSVSTWSRWNFPQNRYLKFFLRTNAKI